MSRAWLSSFLVEVDDQKLIVTAAHFPDGNRSQGFKARFTDPPMKLDISLAIRQYGEPNWWDVAVLRANEPASRAKAADGCGEPARGGP